MKALAAVALVLALGSGTVAGKGDPKLQILVTEEAWITALLQADTAALDTMLAGEYLVTYPNGVTCTKTELLADLATGTVRFDSFRVVSNDILVYDRTATVTGRCLIRLTNNGKSISYEAKHLRVYVYRHDHWELAAHQFTQVEK